MKKFRMIIMLLLVAVGCFGFASCEGVEPAVYTVQYDDNNGVNTIEVEAGAVYHIPAISTERLGYDFLGWFDAETGGTKYISNNGSALAVFSDRKNIILHAQYQPKSVEVNFIVENDAEINGDSTFSVVYGENLVNLNITATKDNSDFIGWYTQQNGAGLQVANAKGWLPNVKVFNQSTFGLIPSSLNNNAINLYAHFKNTTYPVKFIITENLEDTLLLEYNSLLADVTLSIDYDVFVFSWTTVSGSSSITNYKTRVDGPLTLYPANPVVVIDLLSSSSEYNGIIVEKGVDVVLPEPTKTNCEFLGWYNGNTCYEKITAIDTNYSLTAMWRIRYVKSVTIYSFYDDGSENTAKEHRMPTNTDEGEYTIMSFDVMQPETGFKGYITSITYGVRNENDKNLHSVRVNFYQQKNPSSSFVRIGGDYCTGLTTSRDRNKGVYFFYQTCQNVLIDFQKIYITCSHYEVVDGWFGSVFTGVYVINYIVVNYEFISEPVNL